MNELEQAVLEITGVLNELAIPHMLIGGLAVAAWGEPRATLDVDVAVWIGADLASAVSEIGRKTRPAVQDLQSFVTKTGVLPVITGNGTRADLIFATFPFEKEMIDRAVDKSLGSVSVRVATVEDLVLLKSVSLRSKDRADVAALLARFGAQLDKTYLSRRLSQFAEALDRPDLLSLIDESTKG